MLIRGAELNGRAGLDVRIRGRRIAEVGRRLRVRRGDELLEARGGALLPGLHDHHIHLLSLAAALGSVRCGPPHVRTRAELASALRAAASDGWLRGVGYHESVAGELTRADLDAWLGDRPARIQHRSGRLWILSSAACRELGVEDGDGRLFDADRRVRERASEADPPDLARVGALLARCGVSGATDATAHSGREEQALLLEASRSGALPQALRMMGRADLPDHPTRGELKIVLHENALPDLDDLVARIARAHAYGRAAAFHCVTRTELVFATSAVAEAGARGGDRIEHASVAPPELVKPLAELGIAVVTQPGFVAERGDAYLDDVEPRDRRWLYRGRGFLDAGVALGGGSDAPFGEPDPWRAMRAAVERHTASGTPFEPDEALTPEEALALFTTRADAPGGPVRRVAAGEPADLCLLDRPWAEARGRLRSSDVRTTWCAGRIVHDAR